MCFVLSPQLVAVCCGSPRTLTQRAKTCAQRHSAAGGQRQAVIPQFRILSLPRSTSSLLVKTLWSEAHRTPLELEQDDECKQTLNQSCLPSTDLESANVDSLLIRVLRVISDVVTLTYTSLKCLLFFFFNSSP